MKIDLTQLKDLASQVPDLLSKGQQVITAAQNMLKPFQGRGNKPDTKKKTADKKAPAEIAAAVAPVKNDKPAVKSTNKTAGETKKQSDEKPNNMAAVT
ncbi:MAG: hypothetical protein K2H98_09705, partial [Duncaniella sp.]|nr:hypothetical protein [Duncaniella sp.]